MKTIRLMALAMVSLVWAECSLAQVSNAILFTENGEKFTAILNGLRQNSEPETNVKIEGLNANFYKLKVIFEDAALGQKNFNLGIEPGTETTYIIKKNNKNEYVLRTMSMVPIAEAPPSPSNAAVVTYNPGAPPYNGESTTTEQVTTTTTTTGTPSGISMGVNINETGGIVSMNLNGMEGTGSTITTQQTTTVTTTTTSTSNPAPVYSEPVPPQAYVPGYSGPVGCPVPMDPGSFEGAKKSIVSKNFEDSKLTMAKQVVGSNCLVAGQVKEIMSLFDFETTRLDFAKYAYTRTYDIGNYYMVNDSFEFESSIDELNQYISSHRR